MNRSGAALRREATQWRRERRAGAAPTLGAHFADCDDAEAVMAAAERLLADTGWVTALLDPLLAALAEDPWFEPSWPIARDALRTTAVLYEDERATVTATVLSARALAALPAPATIVFTGRPAVVRYHRAGGARLLRRRATPGAVRAEPLPPIDLHDGAVLRLDDRDEAQLIAGATSDVVTLAVASRLNADTVAREHALRDGALVETVPLDPAPAQRHLLLTLLRLTGRRDAGACFDAATRDGAGSQRWAAMREWLALDPAAALPRLAALAEDGEAEVRAAARATLALVERSAPCRG